MSIPTSRGTETIDDDGLVVDRRERRTVTWDDIHTYTRISPFKAVEEHTLRLFHNDEMHDTVADAVVLQFRTREERDALLAVIADKPPAPFVFAALLSPRMRAMHDLLIDNNDLAEAA